MIDARFSISMVHVVSHITSSSVLSRCSLQEEEEEEEEPSRRSPLACNSVRHRIRTSRARWFPKGRCCILSHLTLRTHGCGLHSFFSERLGAGMGDMYASRPPDL